MKDVVRRLENWARYYRPHYIYKSCGSAERAYRAPWRQWVLLVDIHPHEETDAADAMMVEMAWRTLPDTYKKALKLRYIESAPIYLIARKAKTKPWLVNELMDKAIQRINLVLTSKIEFVNVNENLNRETENDPPHGRIDHSKRVTRGLQTKEAAKAKEMIGDVVAYFVYRCPVCKAEYVEKRQISDRDRAPVCCGTKTKRIQTPVLGYVTNPKSSE